MSAQASTLGEILARETQKHAGGMELRTGNSNQRHGEISTTLVIADNVNNFHQAAGVGLKCTDPREGDTNNDRLPACADPT